MLKEKRYIVEVKQGIRVPERKVTLQNIKEGYMSVEGSQVKMTEEERAFYVKGIMLYLVETYCRKGSNPYKALINLTNVRELEKIPRDFKGLVMLYACGLTLEREGKRYIKFTNVSTTPREDVEELKSQALKLMNKSR